MHAAAVQVDSCVVRGKMETKHATASAEAQSVTQSTATASAEAQSVTQSTAPGQINEVWYSGHQYYNCDAACCQCRQCN